MNIFSQERDIMSKIYYLNRLFPNSNFRDEDEKIIESIIESIKSKAIIDIRTVAQMNYTSQSSISRLAKRAGFNNFKELIFSFQKNTHISLQINWNTCLL